MTINTLLAGHVLGQLKYNLVGLERDMYVWAKSWKSSALSQNVPVERLLDNVNSCMSEVYRRVDWSTYTRKNTEYWGPAMAKWVAEGGVVKDIEDQHDRLESIANFIRNQTVRGYSDIVNICDYLLTETAKVPSLWPMG